VLERGGEDQEGMLPLASMMKCWRTARVRCMCACPWCVRRELKTFASRWCCVVVDLLLLRVS